MWTPHPSPTVVGRSSFPILIKPREIPAPDIPILRGLTPVTPKTIADIPDHGSAISTVQPRSQLLSSFIVPSIYTALLNPGKSQFQYRMWPTCGCD